jgi:hypothetical protein
MTSAIQTLTGWGSCVLIGARGGVDRASLPQVEMCNPLERFSGLNLSDHRSQTSFRAGRQRRPVSHQRKAVVSPTPNKAAIPDMVNFSVFRSWESIVLHSRGPGERSRPICAAIVACDRGGLRFRSVRPILAIVLLTYMRIRSEEVFVIR